MCLVFCVTLWICVVSAELHVQVFQILRGFSSPASFYDSSFDASEPESNASSNGSEIQEYKIDHTTQELDRSAEAAKKLNVFVRASNVIAARLAKEGKAEGAEEGEKKATDM